MARRLYTAHIMVVFQDEDGWEGAAGEIARDIEGTIKRDFANFIRDRKATVKGIATSVPVEKFTTGSERR